MNVTRKKRKKEETRTKKKKKKRVKRVHERRIKTQMPKTWPFKVPVVSSWSILIQLNQKRHRLNKWPGDLSLVSFDSTGQMVQVVNSREEKRQKHGLNGKSILSSLPSRSFSFFIPFLPCKLERANKALEA